MKMQDRVKLAAEASMKRQDIDGGSLYTSGFEAGAAWALSYVRFKNSKTNWAKNPCPNKNTRNHRGCEICDEYSKGIK